MKVIVSPTHEQIAAALAHVWGCPVSEVAYNPEQVNDCEVVIHTDVKGVTKAERTITKVLEG